jgi:citrate synthase
MLGFPTDLFTPLFAVARIPGWCAHRIEEITTGNRIMRPAYKAVASQRRYVELSKR